jgi:hypothetical protein
MDTEVDCTSLETIFNVLLGVVVSGLLVLLVLGAVLVHYTNNAASPVTASPSSDTTCSVVVNSTACPPPTDCQAGVLTTLDDSDLGLCRFLDKSVGSACSSQCFDSSAETTCDADHVCSSANVTACLGYCEITDPEASIIHFSHPTCVDKLKFKDYFTWNVADGSSELAQNWLRYSDLAGDCHAEHGCQWYATALRFYQDDSLGDWLATTGTVYACTDFLDMNNSECIHAQTIEMNSNMSDVLYRNYLDPYTSVNLTTMHFQATVCNFWYECAPLNQTFYSDPQFLQKRGVAASSPVTNLEAYVAHVKRNAGRIGEQFGPALDQWRKRANP